MAIKVRKRIKQPIDRSWKDTSLEYADPTAAKRTKKAIKKRVPKHGIGVFLPGGGMAKTIRKMAPKLLPKDKRKTAKNPLAVDIQGKGSKPTSKVREQQKAEKMKADTAAYRKKYLANKNPLAVDIQGKGSKPTRSKAKDKPIRKFETIEAKKGGQASGSRRSQSIRKTVGKIKGTPSEKKRDIDSPETPSDRYGTLPIIRPKTGTSKTKVGKTDVPSQKMRNMKVYERWEKPNKKYGGGKVKYRSIGGKVVNGNDITRMIYD